MLVYTSITKSYLPKARVLASSLKEFHPTWKFVLLYSDDLPVGFNLKNEPFDEILMIDELGIPNWEGWAFGHSIVELCTAVKGTAAELLASRNDVKKIMYIDPDIKVFSSLSNLENLLDEYDILLTPHLLDIETEFVAIQDNEISALKHGVYNLGFFAANTSSEQGLQFVKWWADRLKKFCLDDIPNGLFTDQRWCDLAPAFFSNLYIVRDRGYNVATWNIAHRKLSKDNEGNFTVAGVPLRFYHFTGYDSGAGFGMLNKYASSQNIAQELWDIYAKDLAKFGHQDSSYKSWKYSKYENGENITSESRRLYRLRTDVQKVFPNPYSCVEPCFYSWWKDDVKNFQNHYNVDQNEKKCLFQHLVAVLKNPKKGIQILKKIFKILKTEGFQSLKTKISRKVL